MRFDNLLRAANRHLARGGELEEFFEIIPGLKPETALAVENEMKRAENIRARARKRGPVVNKGMFRRHIIRELKGRELHATKGWRTGRSYGV